MSKKILFFFFILAYFATSNAQVNPVLLYRASQDDRCREWVDSIFNKMTLKEKVGQLFIYTIAPVENKVNLDLLDQVVQEYKVGGLLFSGGLLENQAKLINRAQDKAKTPLMITFDGEWGLAMRIKSIPAYPRNMVLGCIRDDKLLFEYGQEVARQCKELGVHVNFAPVADVNINPKNPVINTRSFGENPVRVADKVVAYSSGLESGGVLSVSKHFPGHGDTDVDSHHALPLLSFTRERLDSIELYPFKQVIRAGLSGVMVGHLEVPAIESVKGLPSSLSGSVVTDLLKNELGFRGLVFTDALEMKGVSGVKFVSLQAIKAGHDMVLCPRQIKRDIQAVLDAVESGELSEEDINSKCRKILTYKYALGLEKEQKIRLSGLEQRINTEKARDLIRRLNLAAITVLKNESDALPMHTDLKQVPLLTIGTFTGCRVFTETLKKYTSVWQLALKGGMPAAERKALHGKLSKHKKIIVSITEKDLTSYKAFLSEFAPDTEVTYIFFTNDKPVSQLAQPLSTASAIVLAHSNDVFVQGQVGNMLFGGATVDGRLASSIGGLFKAGTGIAVSPQTPHKFDPSDYGFNARMLNDSIEAIAREGIKEGAYPGCQIVVLKDGKTMYEKSFGTIAGGKSRAVTPDDIYDIASLTKTTATLLAVMKLYDKGAFNLSDKVSIHLPFLRDTDKENITIRELLYHESGLPSTISFFLKAIDQDSYNGRLYSARKDAQHTVQIDPRMYAQPNFKFHKGLTSLKSSDKYKLQVCDNIWLDKSFNDSIAAGIVTAKMRDKRYRYSCVGFVVLQKMVERLSGSSLDDFVKREFYDPMGLEYTAFLPLRFFPKEQIVPSSVDKFLRKETIQGYVHDETSAFQGGISGNAGLFSNAREIGRIHQMILNGGELDGVRYLSKETCQLFTRAKSKKSRRGLGFDRPDVKDQQKSPCGKLAPASVYGHTGFTGTCTWVDPDNKLVYVFLSNRIYPDAHVNKLSKLNIRSRIQDVIYKSMKSGSRS